MAAVSIQTYDDAAQRTQVIALWKAVALKGSGSEVVGTIMAGYDGHRGWLYSLAVLPEHRRAGIGSALVRHAEQALVSRGCLKINLQVLESNSLVVAFYEALGYSVEPRVSLGKRLKAEN